MPYCNPNPQIWDGAGDTQFTVQVPSNAQNPVQCWADNSGDVILATIAVGGSATFYSPQGFFFVVSPGGPSAFLVTAATQAFVAETNLSEWSPSRGLNLLSNSSLGQNSLYFVPFDIQNPVYASRVNLFASIGTTFSNSNATGSAGLTMSAALYSLGAQDQINSFWSMSAFMAISNSSDTALSVSQPNGISNSGQVSSISTTFATSNASTWLATSMGGFRVVPLPANLTLNPGRYWLAFAQSSTSANASFRMAASYLQETVSNQINFQPFGGASSASNASSPQVNRGLGTYSATTGGFPSSIGLTAGAILGAPTMGIPYFNFSGFATNASEA